MPFPNLLRRLTPKSLFLIDAGGAFVSALMLGVVLVNWEPLFGMPANVLYLLAGIAGLFAIYSMTCFLRFPTRWQPFLAGIAWANLSYCGLTLALVILLYSKLTYLGIAYFGGEIILVVLLALTELRMVSSQQTSAQSRQHHDFS